MCRIKGLAPPCNFYHRPFRSISFLRPSIRVDPFEDVQIGNCACTGIWRRIGSSSKPYAFKERKRPMGGAGGKIKKDGGPRGGVSLAERNEFD